MKVAYFGIPKEYVDFADGIVAYMADAPFLEVRAISIPRLAVADLAYQTPNPPDDLVRFWIKEQRLRDSNYWVRRLMAYVSGAVKQSRKNLVIILVGYEDDPRASGLVDVVYSGNMHEAREGVLAILSAEETNVVG